MPSTDAIIESQQNLEKEIQTSRIISLQKECGLLQLLKDIYISKTENPEDRSADESTFYFLVKNLYHSWQFFYDNMEGLNSGEIGAVFNRLIAESILDDLPDFYEYQRGKDKQIDVQINTEKKEIMITLIIKLEEQTEERHYMRFLFHASLDQIEKRITKIFEELGKLRTYFVSLHQATD